ncbi:5-oxopent-3-ene-1,2,5-tricarboxylate decarboxylase/2-hydroxyhepta-2,4-diene-1,7-dioate isomerase [Paraburkholderia bannensis]|uniref:5-oxopent-3-ene-1,2,5-tricarboxylate decarboxylase/2-hydroxyhepta-2,4-diene-1,7-dioate isomerase n=1 Tax=Paraburkholderia bannensis TaxID=765414 RepID=A0A7W9U5B5_9BURK|nr:MULTISPECIES: fumarylacetoacetate hydrolase family protein [Paraburkholderia]MBB3261510.1 5-oxopent-3-ene-1,2,5-tricarboxylate decarboxylase/2-hydroxyhepta-2,4-diene-1,7-dioate isomerase [Paraburkholderia sp. WP4_3_2]MBB6106566.1 5-oxopent-3-ene-1,2,5-tricarboxylate decarboxylase/2-hydroxyhepta-2,4-diene-1,7-dioate isomerase [Paraburkholderia bannensis]
MFSVDDHLLHLEGEALPRDVSAAQARALLAGGARCRAPVSGAVYGTLLNDRHALEALGDAVNAPPYKAPPRAPILYLKPRNTLAGHGARVVVPGAQGLQVGASLGVVIGRTATRVAARVALDYIAGYTLVADLSVPHDSVYRPSVRFRARDSFCVIGPTVLARKHVADADNLAIHVDIEGAAPFSANTATNVRKVAQLIADITDFMTLSPGDVITTGVRHGSPVAHEGARATISIEGWQSLAVEFIAPHTAQGATA